MNIAKYSCRIDFSQNVKIRLKFKKNILGSLLYSILVLFIWYFSKFYKKYIFLNNKSLVRNFSVLFDDSKSTSSLFFF